MRPGSFVGRIEERATVERLAAEAATGLPRVVCIDGEPGSGKTALLDACARSFDGFTPMRAEAVDGADVAPLWTFGQLIPTPAVDPFAAGLQLLARLADAQSATPVAVLVEDLHWADAVSREALAVAFARLQGGDRVLAVVTSRPTGTQDRWARFATSAGHATRIQLGPLSGAEVGALASSSGVALSGRAADALQRHTGGQPLYVRTLLAELTADQLHVDGPLPAPRSLAVATVARVAGLSAPATGLLAALAVVGAATPGQLSALVAAVGDRSDPSTHAGALVTAASTGIVTAGEAGVLTFQHPLQRTAVYDDLAPTRRRALHLAAAGAAADASTALDHRVAAADLTDDALAADLEHAALTVDGRRAIRYLSAASDLSSSPELLTGRLLGAAHRAMATNDVQELRRLVPRIETLAESAERDTVLGWLAWQDGDNAEAERWLRQATVGPTRDRAVHAEAWMQLGSILALQSRGVEAVDAAEQALTSGVLDEAGLDRAWLVFIRAVTQRDGGVRALELLTERYPDPWEDALTGLAGIDAERLRVRGLVHFFAGQPDAAVVWFGRALAAAGRGQLAGSPAHIHVMRAQNHLARGTWDDALLDAHRAIELATDARQDWVLPQSHGVAARVHAGQGRFDVAEQHLAHNSSANASTSSYEAVVMDAVARASIADARGHPDDVVEALAAMFDGNGPPVPMADTLEYWPMYIHALVATGRRRGAGDALDAYERAAAARRLPVAMQLATIEGHSRLVAGDAPAALASFERATGAWSDSAELLDRAVLCLLHGRVLRAVGRRQQAIDVLQTGRRLTADAHAQPYVARFDHELDEIGEVPVAGARRAALDLTDREGDVAALVGRGLTNKEVAAELYVSVKAVEYHLGNIYGKLGVSNRRELRDLLART